MAVSEKPERVTIFEVGPRDGLQSLKQHIPVAAKVVLIDALSKSGLQKIETTSFVNPNWVPQLADGAEVMSNICRNLEVSYTALVPNLRGVEAAIATGCDEVSVFISASQGFSGANLNCTVEESLGRIRPAINRALDENIPVRGYLSCVVECPFDGETDPATVADLTGNLLGLGCYEVSLGDTIGSATPDKTGRLLEALLKSAAPSQLAGHFHDTLGTALSNITTALDYGLRTFDSSIGGLGGCPYAPGAPGNVDTRALVELLHEHNFETGIDLDAIANAEEIAGNIVR